MFVPIRYKHSKKKATSDIHKNVYVKINELP